MDKKSTFHFLKSAFFFAVNLTFPERHLFATDIVQ